MGGRGSGPTHPISQRPRRGEASLRDEHRPRRIQDAEDRDEPLEDIHSPLRAVVQTRLGGHRGVGVPSPEDGAQPPHPRRTTNDGRRMIIFSSFVNRPSSS